MIIGAVLHSSHSAQSCLYSRFVINEPEKKESMRFGETHEASRGVSLGHDTKFLAKKIDRGGIAQQANDIPTGEYAWKTLCLVAIESLLPLYSDHPFGERRIVFVFAHARLLQG